MRSILLITIPWLIAGCLAAPTVTMEEPAQADDPTPYRPNAWPGTLLTVPEVITTISDGAEPSIVVSKDGSTIWIGDTSGVYLSQDGGTTWDEADVPVVVGTADGWVIAEDDAGAVYFSTTNTVSLEFVRSLDKGRTAESSTAITDVAPVADRPWIAARGDGEVALFMYDFGRSMSETCVRSTDGGTTWTDRSLLSGAAQGGGALFDEDGNMYVGEDSGRIMSYGNNCLGATGDLGVTYYEMFPQDVGAVNMLKPAYEDGVLYMTAASPDNSKVLLSGLPLDTGTRKVLEIPAPSLQSNTFMTLSVHDQRIAVAWYGSETPGDPSLAGFDGAWNVYVAFVDHFWTEEPTFDVMRLTDAPNHVGDICMGGVGCGTTDSVDGEESDRDLLDYFDIDHDPEGGVHIAYGDDERNPDVRREVVYAYIAPPSLREPAETPETTNEPPTAEFEFTVKGPVISVDASASSDPEDGALSYTWDWGDGTFGDGVTANHTYNATGSYGVRLTVTDPLGAQAHSAFKLVNIQSLMVEDPGSPEGFEDPKGIPAAGWVAGVAAVGLAFRLRRR